MEKKDLESEPFRKLFIGGLSIQTTEDVLRDYFEHWGEIVDCVVLKEPGSKKSRGFGFVTFKKSHMVDDAQKARPHKIDGRVVECKRAMPREDCDRPEAHLTSNKAYISGIRNDHTEEDLMGYFSTFGVVEKVEIMTEHGSNVKRGFAFVTFNDYDCVDKVVLIKNHHIKGFRCDARKAISKEDMNRLKKGEDIGGRGGGKGLGSMRGSRGGAVSARGGGGRLDNADRFRGERERFPDRPKPASLRGPERIGNLFQGRGRGFGDQDDFGAREGFIGSRGESQEFGRRDHDFSERDHFGMREDPFGGRGDPFAERSRFDERDQFGGREGFRGGMESYSDRKMGFGGRDSLGERDEFRDRFDSRDNYRGDWGTGGGGFGANRGDHMMRDEPRGGNGFGSRLFDDGIGSRGATGNTSGLGGRREDYDSKQGIERGFGTGYESSQGGGAMRDNSYSTRASGPYGGGFGSSSRNQSGGDTYSSSGAAAGFRDQYGGGSSRDGFGFGGKDNYSTGGSGGAGGFGTGAADNYGNSSALGYGVSSSGYSGQGRDGYGSSRDGFSAGRKEGNFGSSSKEHGFGTGGSGRMGDGFGRSNESYEGKAAGGFGSQGNYGGQASSGFGRGSSSQKPGFSSAGGFGSSSLGATSGSSRGGGRGGSMAGFGRY